MAGSFDGSTAELIGGSAVVSGPPFTVAAWFWTTNTTVEEVIVSITTTGSGNHWWSLRTGGATVGDPIRYIYKTTGQTAVSTSTGYSASTWHHAAAVEAASNDHKVYIDGGSVGTDTANRAVAGVDTTSIGVLRTAADWANFNGYIAEVGVWNVALDATELGILAAGYSPLFVRPGSLVLYHPIWGGNLTVPVSGISFSNTDVVDAAAHPPTFYPASPMMGKAIAAGTSIPAFDRTYRQRRIA